MIPTNPAPPLLTYRQTRGDYPYLIGDSAEHLPNEDQLAQINATVPWWFLIYDSATSLAAGTIGAQQTDRGQVTVQEDCWLTSLIASSSQAAGFAVQLYLPGRELTLMDSDILNVNFSGTAARKLYLPTPVHVEVGDQLESRVINLAVVANAIQIVGFGLRPDMRRKIT